MDPEPEKLDWSICTLANTFSEFELDVIHRAGISHQAADALSRPKSTGMDQAPIKDEIPVLFELQSMLSTKYLFSPGRWLRSTTERQVKREKIREKLKE